MRRKVGFCKYGHICIYFSGCIVCFASFYLVEFCGGSLHVESETVFIYKLMFSVHVVIIIIIIIIYFRDMFQPG